MRGNKTVLIVEDDRDLQALLTAFLKKSGYKVMSLFDGPIHSMLRKQALPDVILLDMDLPHANGVDIGLELKSDPDTRDIPVIMLSANADIEALSKRAGAVDYIPKPFQARELLNKIVKYIRSAFKQGPPPASPINPNFSAQA